MQPTCDTDGHFQAGKPALTPEQVRAFVSRFQPAYEAYLPALYRDGPRGAKAAGKAVIAIEVDVLGTWFQQSFDDNLDGFCNIFF